MNHFRVPVQGLIFDMDGTLVDNMRFHNLAWQLWFEDQGHAFDADTFFERTAGRTNAEIFAMFLPNIPSTNYPELVRSKELAYQKLYEPHISAMPGLINLLEQAKQFGLPCAIGTAAPQMNIDFILQPLALAAYFQAIVNPSATVRGKPHPDIFLEAALRMNVKPSQCIVFEDAPLGIQAAHSGTMKSVALTSHLPASELAKHHPMHISNDFTQLTLTQTDGVVYLEQRL